MARPAAHRPVLLDEALELLAPRPGDVVVDGTLGAGGHSEALLEAVGPNGRVVGIDRDPRAIELAGARLSRFGSRFLALRGDHEDLLQLLEARGITAADRVLFDLGLSSMQVDDPGRGFSFRHDGPLDMRMDPDRRPTAAELVATLAEEDLARLIRRYGEERRARSIARAIVRRREERPIVGTAQLAALVEQVAGPAARRFRIHPATRTFQALRIAVNREVDNLDRVVDDAVSLLRPGGRIAAIAFHSLEDRKVKHALKALADRCTCPPRLPICACGREDLIRVVTRKPVRPSVDEIDSNPRARSAKLRVAERL